jgi:hypothetical protein
MYLEDGDTGQVAHTAILHETEHPSAILLPIVEPEQRQEGNQERR